MCRYCRGACLQFVGCRNTTTTPSLATYKPSRINNTIPTSSRAEVESRERHRLAHASVLPWRRSHSLERRSAWRTGSGTRCTQQRHTSSTADARLIPWPTETRSGLKPSTAVVRSAAPHTQPESPRRRVCAPGAGQAPASRRARRRSRLSPSTWCKLLPGTGEQQRVTARRAGAWAVRLGAQQRVTARRVEADWGRPAHRFQPSGFPSARPGGRRGRSRAGATFRCRPPE